MAQLGLLDGDAGDGPDRAPESPRRRGGGVAPASPRLGRPAALHRYGDRLWLGTSSWSFPGWAGLVYADAAPEARLARDGLEAYAQHPLLNGVGLDRTFYAPLSRVQYAQYAAQVPASFRFLVKAPDLVTGAVVRDETGRQRAPNASHLDPATAIEHCLVPAAEGLGERLGAIVFQFSPLPRAWLDDAPAWIARLDAFLGALPRGLPLAVEVRDAALLTPRLLRTLVARDVALCVGLHARMPPADRQLRALAALEALRGGAPGPLVVRWSLHAGLGYEQARTRYQPFSRLVDEDPVTREALAARVAAGLLAGSTALVIANNKAEGSAPLTLARLAEAIAARLEAG